jgi:ribosomal protein L10
MSDNDGFNEVKDIVKKAAYWGQPAVAITDHGVVQAFPDAAKEAAKQAKNGRNIKIIYGVEGYLYPDEDATAPARVLAKAMKDLDKMSFKGAVVEGSFYDAAGVEALSKIPGRDTLIAKFMGSIQSPVSKFVRTLAAIAEAKAEGKEMPEAPAEAPAEEAPAAEAAEETPAE